MIRLLLSPFRHLSFRAFFYIAHSTKPIEWCVKLAIYINDNHNDSFSLKTEFCILDGADMRSNTIIMIIMIFFSLKTEFCISGGDRYKIAHPFIDNSIFKPDPLPV